MRKVDGIFQWARPFGRVALLLCLLGPASAHAQPVATQEPIAARSPRKTSLDPFVLVGGAVRLGDAPLFNITQRFGGNFGVGFSYQYEPFSVGLSYEHLGLGREDSGVGRFGVVHIDRSLDTIWGQLRMRLSGLTWGTPFLGIGVGATWQEARLGGVVLLDQGVGGARSFGCSATDSFNGALRFGGGVEIPLASTVSFVTDAAFDAYRLSSDILDYCAPGAGATSAFLLRAGLVYRYDLSEGRSAKR